MTANNETMVQGGTVPTLGYTLSPVVTLSTNPTCTTTGSSSSPVGTYPITCSGAAGTGETFTYINGTLTITAPRLRRALSRVPDPGRGLRRVPALSRLRDGDAERRRGEPLPLPLLPSTHLFANVADVWQHGAGNAAVPFGLMLTNSLVMALGIALGKIAISILSAYAIVYFRFPLRGACFWLIFVTLMLPVEVRIFPTVEVVSKLHMMDSYAGLTVPLIASATATFLFRQFFMTLPDELIEAARIDGAGPMRFFFDIALRFRRPTSPS